MMQPHDRVSPRATKSFPGGFRLGDARKKKDGAPGWTLRLPVPGRILSRSDQYFCFVLRKRNGVSVAQRHCTVPRQSASDERDVVVQGDRREGENVTPEG